MKLKLKIKKAVSGCTILMAAAATTPGTKGI
jgi:hypothetical protein